MTDIAKLGFSVDSKQVSNASRELDKMAKSADKADKESRQLKATTGGVSNAMGLLKTAIGALALGVFAKKVFDTTIQFQRMEKTLTFATGSLENARKEMAFIRKESQRLGQDLIVAGRSYSKLAASASQLGLTTLEIRDIFTGVGAASTVMGLSAYEAEGAFLALQQMLAKGKVQAEELRGQLGERIPTAVADMSKALGFASIGDFYAELEQGNINAEEAVLALAQRWKSTFGQQIPSAAENANVAVVELDTAFQELLASFGEGAVPGAVTAMEGMAEVFADPAFVNGVREFGQMVGEAIAYMVENKDVLASFGGALAGLKVGGVPGAVVGAGGGKMYADYQASKTPYAGSAIEDLRNKRSSYQRDIKTLQTALAELNNQDFNFARDVLGVDSAADMESMLQKSVEGLRAINAEIARRDQETMWGGMGAGGEFGGAMEEARLRNEQELRDQQRASAAQTEVDQKALDKLAKSYSQLEDSLDPVAAATKKYTTDLRTLQEAKVKLNLTDARYIELQLELDEVYAQSLKRITENADAQKGYASSQEAALKGAEEAMKSYAKAANDNFTLAENAVTSSLKAIEDSMVDVIMQSKSAGDAFRDMSQVILAEITRIAVKKAILGPLEGAMGSFFDGLFTPSRTGNVMSGGRMQAFANGGVVNTPTLFPFAGGTGLMGEAGAEAIMPLSRLPNGDLGVKAGGGGSPDINVTVINETGANADADVQSGVDSQGQIQLLVRLVSSEIAQNDIPYNGPVSRSLQSTFNMNRAIQR